ncbi:MAG: adenosylcobinamide-phosphate synthase CbiB [Lachnospiraceae bacterium]|nr:adenosylcobinamide-phosphate synthase CbiB [Lachnospiraceae bacterium]
MDQTLLALLAGFLLDIIIGDPHWIYHPVRLVGHLISGTEKWLRRCFPKTEKGERTAGLCLVLVVSGVTTGAAALLFYLAGFVGQWLVFGLQVLMCYQLLATRALKDESMKVYRELEREDLPGARKAVSMIVGRDTENLDAAGVTKAAVETVAENTSDGIIAPLFYMAIGGPILGWCYKSVNTMDSMVGYKNDRYLNFGRFAAKLDDVVNYIPARLSGLLMIAASFLAGLDGKKAAAIFRRDRMNHASPNSAQTEAVMAGALNVQLAGDACYFGTLYHKKTIGDPVRPIEKEDIKRANRLLYLSAALSLIVFTALRGIVLCVFF